MSTLAQTDSLQQEYWDLCDVEPDWDDREIRRLGKELEALYSRIAHQFYPPDRSLTMILLCGINYENIRPELQPK